MLVRACGQFRPHKTRVVKRRHLLSNVRWKNRITLASSRSTEEVAQNDEEIARGRCLQACINLIGEELQRAHGGFGVEDALKKARHKCTVIEQNFPFLFALNTLRVLYAHPRDFIEFSYPLVPTRVCLLKLGEIMAASSSINVPRNYFDQFDIDFGTTGECVSDAQIGKRVEMLSRAHEAIVDVVKRLHPGITSPTRLHQLALNKVDEAQRLAYRAIAWSRKITEHATGSDVLVYPTLPSLRWFLPFSKAFVSRHGELSMFMQVLPKPPLGPEESWRAARAWMGETGLPFVPFRYLPPEARQAEGARGKWVPLTLSVVSQFAASLSVNFDEVLRLIQQGEQGSQDQPLNSGRPDVEIQTVFDLERRKVRSECEVWTYMSPDTPAEKAREFFRDPKESGIKILVFVTEGGKSNGELIGVVRMVDVINLEDI